VVVSPTAWWVIAAMCFGVAIGAPEYRELSALALGAGLALDHGRCRLVATGFNTEDFHLASI
jgi:hypothetical protein